MQWRLPCRWSQRVLGAPTRPPSPISSFELRRLCIVSTPRNTVSPGWKLPVPKAALCRLSWAPWARGVRAGDGGVLQAPWDIRPQWTGQSPVSQSYGCSHGISARCGAATGPISAEVRRQEVLKLERTGARPSLASSCYLSIRVSAAPPSSASSSLRVESKPPCSCSNVPGQI
jgi:hypothetical protein